MSSICVVKTTEILLSDLFSIHKKWNCPTIVRCFLSPLVCFHLRWARCLLIGLCSCQSLSHVPTVEKRTHGPFLLKRIQACHFDTFSMQIDRQIDSECSEETFTFTGCRYSALCRIGWSPNIPPWSRVSVKWAIQLVARTRTSSLESFVSGGTEGKAACKLWKACLRFRTRLLSLAAFSGEFWLLHALDGVGPDFA